MSQIKFACLLAIATLLGLGSVSAQNTPPVVGPAGTETFSGTQTAGINVNDGTIFTVNVNSLIGPITPSAGTNGIIFSNGSAGNLTLNAGLSTSAPITISSTNAAGISILSVGNPPGATTNKFLNSIPVPGTPSASGGTVIVNSFANITTIGDNSYGIMGKSSTSGYPQSTIDTLNKFTTTGISFTVDPATTGTLSAFSVVLETGSNDGSFTSGTAGSGDQLVLNSDGSFTFVPGATFSGTGIGSVYDIGVGYRVDGTNTNGSSQTDSGTLVIQVTKTGSNSFTTGTVGSFFTTFGSGTSPSVFPDLVTYVAGLKSLAGASGAGNSVTITNSGTIQTSGSAAHGIYAVSQGGGGGNGSDASITHSSTQGGGGSGGGTVTVTANGMITTGSDNATGVLATSIGGDGGKGGDSGYTRNAKAGGSGGIGGLVNVYGSGTISTSGSQASGILALSQGGNGGAGGNGSTFVSGDGGGNGGMGGSVNVSGTWNITTTGNQAHG
ncbi:MAG: hypothetical protein WCD79_11580, partial [Chthoniobacteraceae bacterium]